MRYVFFRPLIVLLPLIGFSAAAELTEQATPAPVQWGRKGAFVVSLARDAASRRVWVGTEDDGVWCLDGVKWTQFKKGEGLGDDQVYAMAVDDQGRVWAGHLRHGVSVYDGKTWRNYDTMTGGPLGSRVFAIKVCPGGPRAGEVWIASDGGLARYWPKDDSWSYVTRADGLPSDQVNAMAFDADGKLFAGTQCDGLAIAGPADNYAAWTVVGGPTRPGTEAGGDGLPSCMVNDVLVTREGTLFVASPWGLGKSTDGGKTFTYRRGADWAEKVKQRTGGAPAGFKPTKDQWTVSEDYVTCLAEDEVGVLWLGYRVAGYEAVEEATEVARHAGGLDPAPGRPGAFVTCLLPVPGAGPLAGTYGHGLVQAEKFFKGEAEVRQPPARVREVAGHPSPAAAPGGKVVDALRARIAKATAAANGRPAVAAFIGDDWTTQGDWMGRYGRQVHALPFYGTGGWASEAYKCDVSVGPHLNKNAAGPYTYWHVLGATTPRVLYIPNSAKRSQGEWNDGSFNRDAYHDEWEGPDLWVDVTVPEGVHRASLYFINYDGHDGGPTTRRRDFLVELKASGRAVGGAHADLDAAPALARTRVAQFHFPVYKQFVLAGPAKYAFKIGRNYSMCTKLSAVFLDRLGGPKLANLPDGVPLMGDVQVRPADVPAGAAGGANVAIRAAADVTTALDAAWPAADAVALQRPGRVLALRLAAAQRAPEELLENWRFKLPLTTAADHAAFATVVAAWREQILSRSPNLADTAFRTKMTEAWKRLRPLVEAKKAPDAATLIFDGAKVTKPDDIKAGLAPYLQARAGASIDTQPAAPANAEAPDAYAAEFKVAAPDVKRLYRLIGAALLYSESLSQRAGERPRRQALAAALAAARAAGELLDDSWLAARVAEGFLVPQLANASKEAGPLDRHAVLTAIVVAHADDPAGLARTLGQLCEGVEAAAAPGRYLELARALHASGKDRDAAEYLAKIDAGQRTAEVEALGRELARKP